MGRFYYSSTPKKRGRPAKISVESASTINNSSSTSNAGTSNSNPTTPITSKVNTALNSSAPVTPTATAAPNTATVNISPNVVPEFIEVYVNDKPVQIQPGSVIIQACAAAGIDIPRFCYHERLAIAGNCRMCLVQVEKMPKLIASCSQPVAPGMRIQTESAQVKKAREGVMEFLLANHPLDCAICDQGGECDLQDQAMAFGSDRSRFNLETEHKRAVENKDFGPLIKTSMNRCIHCTRCVRFGNEVAGLPELGTTGRGNDMQIGTYVQSMLGSELSANIIDLCPVGALTSKPYEFAARPWELRKTESIDVMDAVGSAIRIDTRGVELMRIQPRTNDSINEEWLSDKSRFVSDALKTQRLTTPVLNGQEVAWSEGLAGAADMIRESKGQVAVIAGPFADAETLTAARDLIASHGSSADLFIAPALYDNSAIDNLRINLPSAHVSQFKSGLTLAQMESIDTLLVIGCNMRHEAPLLNARIRKAFLKRNTFSAAAIGCSPDDQLNFDFEWLGGDLTAMNEIKSAPIWKELCESANPAIFVSTALISDHPESALIFEQVQKIAAELSEANPAFINNHRIGMCWVPRSASHVASQLIGYNRVATKAALSKYKTLLLIGSADTPRVASDQKLIYLGHHADRLAPVADAILPSAAYSEKSGTFVNLEGRVQRTQPALEAPGQARSDWSILRALSEFIDPSNPLPYNTLDELRSFSLSKYIPSGSFIPCDPEREKASLTATTTTTTATTATIATTATTTNNHKTITPHVPFKTVNIPDFYLTDPISRSSATMAKCSLAFTSKIATSTKEVDEQFAEIIKSN